MKLNTVICCL